MANVDLSKYRPYIVIGFVVLFTLLVIWKMCIRDSTYPWLMEETLGAILLSVLNSYMVLFVLGLITRCV